MTKARQNNTDTANGANAGVVDVTGATTIKDSIGPSNNIANISIHNNGANGTKTITLANGTSASAGLVDEAQFTADSGDAE